MPFRSKAQWRMAARNWPKARFKKWVKVSPPYSKLPEKAPKKRRKRTKKRRS